MKLWIIFAIFVLFSCSALAGSVEIPQESLSLYYVESATGEEAETYDVDIQGYVICLLPKDIEYEKKTCLSYDCKTYKLQKEKFAAPGQIRLNKNKEFEGIVSLSDNKFCYEADPNVDRWLKFGENSIVVVSTASTNFWLSGGMYFMPQNVQGNYVSVDYSLVQLPIDHVHNSVGYWNESAHGYIEASDGLQLSYHFNTNANPVVDSAVKGGTSNISVSGAVFTSSGKYGGAYNYDGWDDFLNLSYKMSYDFTQPYTISLWFYDAVTANSHYLLASSENGLGPTSNVLLYKQSASQIRWAQANSSGALQTISINGLTQNEWHQVFLIFNGSHRQVGFDGAFYAGTAISSPLGSFLSNRSYLGAYFISNYSWNGTIDEVKIWNRSLTADEVKQEYIIGARNFQYSGNYPPGESYYIEKGAEWLMPVINRDVAFAGYPYLSGSSITLNYENRRPICDIGQNSTALDCDCPPGSNMNTVTFICQEVVGGASSITLVSDEPSESGQDFFSDIGQFVNKNVGLVAILLILVLMLTSSKKRR